MKAVQYIKDEKGNDAFVVMPRKQYDQLLELLEEAQDLSDAKNRAEEPSVPLDKVIAKLDKKHGIKRK